MWDPLWKTGTQFLLFLGHLAFFLGLWNWKNAILGAILPGKSLICKNNTDCGHFFGTKKYRTHGTFFRKTAKKYRTYGTFADTRRKVPYVRYSLGVFPTNLALFAKKYRTYGTYGRIQKTCRQNPKPCDFEDFAKMYRTYGIFLQKALKQGSR